MSLNQEKYQIFAQLLNKLREEESNKQLDALELQKRIALIMQFFQEQIVSLAIEKGREQSYRTEMSKQLRLLSIDAIFLQGARQASTTQSRLDAINLRLTTLVQYCDAILQSESEQQEHK